MYDLIVLDEINLTFTKSIGAPKVQTVRWDDIGGLINVKDEIMSALRPSMLNMRRSGIYLIIVKKGSVIKSDIIQNYTLKAFNISTNC